MRAQFSGRRFTDDGNDSGEIARVGALERETLEVGAHAVDGSEDDEVEVETYVWTEEEDMLEEGEWDFEHFRNEKLRYWVDKDFNEEYTGRSTVHLSMSTNTNLTFA